MSKGDEFPMNYLAAAQAIDGLRERLMWIGMSGNANFERLCADFIKHGCETYRDINRDVVGGKTP